MSVVTRGVKNAFRNWLRSLAVVLILSIGIGLSMSMLVANEAVNAKITDLKASIGTTLTISPAGSQGFEGGGEPLTTDEMTTISNVEHVVSVSATSSFRLQNEDSSSDTSSAMPGGMGGSSSSTSTGTTNLVSSVDAGTLGRRNNGVSDDSTATFTMPITGTGSTGTDSSGEEYNITSGRNLTSSDTDYVAVIGTDLAIKNSLSVGSTFTAYDQTFTVVGIFDQGTTFDNAGVAVPLSVAQTLTETTGEVSAIIATVDSADNVESTQEAVQTALGEDVADVTSSESTVATAIESLQGVQQISIIAFVGALVAAAVIIFLIMMMIVRERRREIGVLKAIGGSNVTIMSQFIVESLVLVFMGAIVGLGVTMVSSNSIASALVSSSTSSSSSATSESGQPGGGMQGGGAIDIEGGQGGMQGSTQLIGQVAANVGWKTIVYGALAAIAIAVVGSAIPAWIISRVRPAVVLRGE